MSSSAVFPDVSGFLHPAYTYVLKFPDLCWMSHEDKWQDLLMPDYTFDDGMDDFYLDMPWPDTPAEHLQFVLNNGPESLWYSVLGNIVHDIVLAMFRDRQNKLNPEYSCYIQVEQGNRLVHVHLVIAGSGLNKYNAKLWRAELDTRWISALITFVERGHCQDDPPYIECVASLHEARARLQGGRQQYVDVLQYRSRAGQQHALRVNGPEFICNYLLPKNLKFHSLLSPERCTPHSAYFDTATKTYVITIINGVTLNPHERKSLYNMLIDRVVQTSEEPVFDGDITRLPQVTANAWTNVAPNTKSQMTKKQSLMLDCMQRCLQNHWLTYEQMVIGCPDLMVMLESQPSGSKLIEQLLNMAHITLTSKHTALSYIQEKHGLSAVATDNKVFHLLNLQGYNGWQAGHWLCLVLSKQAGKQNTVSFFGPASTGKTNLAKAIVNAVSLYGCVNHQNKSFVFNDCAAKLINWWEECVMHADWVEQAKCIMGGTEFRIDRKHRDSQLLPQTPLIISTNNDIYTVTGGNTVSQVHAKPIKDRVVQFNFMKSLPQTFGEIAVSDVTAWITTCATRFEGKLTLQGFYEEWGLTVVPNQFPTAVLCPSHSQDYILHECGLCVLCGGYLPLRREPDADDNETPPNSPASDISEVDEGWIDFLISLEKTPPPIDETDFGVDPIIPPMAGINVPISGPRRRRREEESNEPDSTTAEPPAKRRLTEENRALVEELHQQVSDEFSSQPVHPHDQQRYEELQATIREVLGESSQAEQEQESEPESQEERRPGLNPSEWGERLGLVPAADPTRESPVVLYCFENMPESSGEESGQED